MAKAQGVSAATVQRIRSARGLKPHRVETFKLSNDKRFEEKLVDVVGLYMNPPDKAVVLCLDEKSQIQALDRTQPSLPMKKGRAGTMTHDYKRNGTTTLFAALDVLSGKVIGQCLPQHTNNEFLHFLKKLDREVPKGLAVHVITDNYGTRATTTSRPGWPSTPGSTSISRPHRARGSTWWSGGSGSSPTKPYAVGCSVRCPSSWPRSRPTSSGPYVPARSGRHQTASAVKRERSASSHSSSPDYLPDG